jgi:hypothetical protein
LPLCRRALQVAERGRVTAGAVRTPVRDGGRAESCEVLFRVVPELVRLPDEILGIGVVVRIEATEVECGVLSATPEVDAVAVAERLEARPCLADSVLSGGVDDAERIEAEVLRFVLVEVLVAALVRTELVAAGWTAGEDVETRPCA